MEKLINERIEKDLETLRQDEDSRDCLREVVKSDYKINDLQINFDNEESIVFNVTFGLSSACMAVDGTAVKFKISEIEKYLK